MMKKLMQNSKAAAAANNIHTHPPKGGGVIFAACSTREDGGLTTKTQVRESRNTSDPSVAAEMADGGSHPAARTPRISPQTPLPCVEPSRRYSDARDATYAREYEAWVAAMSPDERAQLTALNLDKPMLDHDRASGTGFEEDMAESNLASYEPDMADLVDGGAEDGDGAADNEVVAEKHDSSPAAMSSEGLWDALRRLLGEILVMPNRSLTVECLAVVSGLSYMGDSLTEIARRHRVTRAAVSKRCVHLTERLSLPPSRAMRSLTARKSYREAQLRRYAKDQRC